MIRKLLSFVLALCLVLSCCSLAMAEGEKTVIQFFFPVQLGGAAANMIDQLVAEFEEANPDIDVDQVFCGNYSDTLTKLTLGLESGEAPQLVILDQRLLSLIAMDAVVCLEDYIAADGGDELMNDFYPGYLASGIYDGKQYALPFQRSVIAMFYNKDHFTEAGLDPEKPPMTWDEYLEIGPKLTKKNEDGSVAHWGVGIATSGWIQQSMCISASETNQKVFSEDGKHVYFDTDAVRKAIQFCLDLKACGASEEGVLSDSTMPASFIEGALTMCAISSGNLTNINNSVDFNYGVCMMPACATEYGASIGGGGDMYMIKCDKTTQEQYDATWKFMRFMSEPDTQARWSVATGYIASRISAKESETMKNYFETVPQAAVMYDILEHAFQQMSVYESSQIGTLFNNMFESVITGESDIESAVAYAQSEAEYTLEDYQ